MFCTIHVSHMHIMKSLCIAKGKIKDARIAITDAPRPACAPLAQEACRSQRISHHRLSKMPHRCQKVPIGVRSSIDDRLFLLPQLVPPQRDCSAAATPVKKWMPAAVGPALLCPTLLVTDGIKTRIAQIWSQNEMGVVYAPGFWKSSPRQTLSLIRYCLSQTVTDSLLTLHLPIHASSGNTS